MRLSSRHPLILPLLTLTFWTVAPVCGAAPPTASVSKTPPANEDAAGEPTDVGYMCKALVWVQSSGKVQVAQVIKSSGSSMLDRACLNGAIGQPFGVKPSTSASHGRWSIYALRFKMGIPAKVSAESRGANVAIPQLSRDQTLNLDPPYYPPIALQQRKEGVCAMHIRVSVEGEIRKIALSQSTGSPELDNACLETMHAAHFLPAQRAGEPVAASTDVWLAWRLPEIAQE